MEKNILLEDSKLSTFLLTNLENKYLENFRNFDNLNIYIPLPCLLQQNKLRNALNNLIILMTTPQLYLSLGISPMRFTQISVFLRLFSNEEAFVGVQFVAFGLFEHR